MEESLVLRETEEGFIYNRSSSNENELLSSIISDRYKFNSYKKNRKEVISPRVLVTCSGMNSISIVLNVLINKYKDIIILYGDELYCDTPRLIQKLVEFYKIDAISMDINNPSDIYKFKGKTMLLYIESCSNPSGFMLDPNYIKLLRKVSKELIIMVDNTWLTSSILNPFVVYEADVVISSLTKYYSGGTCIAGMIATKSRKLYDYCLSNIKTNGIHVSPYHCQLIIDNIKTLDERIENSSFTTLKVIKYLTEKGYDVIHPSLDNHPSYKVASKLLVKYPSVFTFTVNKDVENTKIWMKSTGIDYKTSFGSPHSRFCNFPRKIDDNNTRVRLSIGYIDNFQDIKSKLSQ